MANSGTGGTRVAVQKFGTFLSGMVMPNIGAFIAWGLITALAVNNLLPGFSFLSDTTVTVGDATYSTNIGLIGATIHYLLPLLIAYTGGYKIYGQRGGVVGAIAAIGVITGVPMNVHMFIGAMIMGPLGGYLMKKADALWDGKIRPGFEMLINNFSAGILGAILALLGGSLIGPAVEKLTSWLGSGVEFLVNNNLLPLASLVIEPAKVLFLNNAINHGVLTPLGISEAQTAGQSILFLLESNPGPGLGILLAFMIFGSGAAKASAPGAALIHFFGGIHEIYFPYVMMRPLLIIAVILGGGSGVATNMLLGGGLRAPASPGSIIAIATQIPSLKAGFAVILSIVVATVVTFLVAAVILKSTKGEDDLAAATAQMESNKGKKSSISGALTGGASVASGGGVATLADPRTITRIVFACDAGMGSSAMGASVLRNKIKKAGIEGVEVKNVAIANLTNDVDLIVTHQDLTERARQGIPDAIHVSVDNFMNSPRYDEVVERIKSGPTEAEAGAAHAAPVASKPIHNIVFACDAGMGSSAMGASVLRNKIKKAGIEGVTVKNVAIANLTDDIDLVVSHQDLTDRARQGAPSADHVSVDNFMNSPRYDEVVERIKQSQ
ncbi:PTS mannitol transporter subunit IICBA [Micrococcales bacterium 31B]|nr:PTS mannitol transporter subunit IICBA [Micrococcales bacterium 31B]